MPLKKCYIKYPKISFRLQGFQNVFQNFCDSLGDLGHYCEFKRFVLAYFSGLLQDFDGWICFIYAFFILFNFWIFSGPATNKITENYV